MILPATTSSAPYPEQQEYYRLGRSLSGEACPQDPVCCQAPARIMLRLQDEERGTRDSDRKRKASQHTSDQAHVRPHLSTRSQGSLFHPHPEPVESLHR